MKKDSYITPFHYKITHSLENALLLVLAFIVYDINTVVIEYIQKTNNTDHRILYISSKIFHFLILLILDILIVLFLELLMHQTP